MTSIWMGVTTAWRPARWRGSSDLRREPHRRRLGNPRAGPCITELTAAEEGLGFGERGEVVGDGDVIRILDRLIDGGSEHAPRFQRRPEIDEGAVP